MKIPTLTDIVLPPLPEVEEISDDWRKQLQESVDGNCREKFYPVAGKKPNKPKIDPWGHVVYEKK